MIAESPMSPSGPVLSLAIETEDVPPHGLEDVLTADAQERSAVARVLELQDIASLTIEYELRRAGAGRFRLKGRIRAAVTQLCVVTLDPVESAIDEPFEVELWPQEDVESLEAAGEEEGASLPLDGPEPMLDGRIDVGQIAYEHLAAALDPYPRKAGVEFEWNDPMVDENDGSGTKPFAGLGEMMRNKESAGR